MQLLPPLPAWNGLHPLIVHFPIALLLVAPLLIAAGLLWRSLSRGLMTAAFVLMLLGTIATWVAVSTGSAVGEQAEKGGARIEAVVEQHEELAESTRTIFTLLTLVFGALLFAPVLLRRNLERMPFTAAHLAFLVLYGGGAIFLVNTAHQGGRIVHEFGVRADMTNAQRGGGMAVPVPAEKSETDEPEDEATENGTRGVGSTPVRGAASPAESPVDPDARPKSPAGGESVEREKHVTAPTGRT